MKRRIDLAALVALCATIFVACGPNPTEPEIVPQTRSPALNWMPAPLTPAAPQDTAPWIPTLPEL